MRIYSFTSSRGIPFVVKLVDTGRLFGFVHRVDAPRMAATEPTVEFYDGRYDHTALGQFVSRYDLDTMFDACSVGSGLMLHGGIPDWQISSVELRCAVAFLTAAPVRA